MQMGLSVIFTRRISRMADDKKAGQKIKKWRRYR